MIENILNKFGYIKRPKPMDEKLLNMVAKFYHQDIFGCKPIDHVSSAKDMVRDIEMRYGVK